MNQKCLVCDVAWELGVSEEKFLGYPPSERAQLIATYLSRLDRDFVMSEFPVRKRKNAAT